MTNARRCAEAVFVSLGLFALAACQEAPVATNAAEDARISRGMEDVAEGQARSEADVANIEANRRQAAQDKQMNAAKRAN